MQPDAQREADRVLASLDKRLALVEQAQRLEAQNAQANAAALRASLDKLGAEVRQSLAAQAAGGADLTATPAGRAVLTALVDRKAASEDHARRLDDVEGWVDGFKGSLGAMRGLVIVLGGLSSALAIIALFVAIGAH